MFATTDEAVLWLREVLLTIIFLLVLGPGKLLMTVEAGEGEMGHDFDYR